MMFFTHAKICLICLSIGSIMQIWGCFEFSLMIWSIGALLILTGPAISNLFPAASLTQAKPLMEHPDISKWTFTSLDAFFSICRKHYPPRKKAMDWLLTLLTYPGSAIVVILICNVGHLAGNDDMMALTSSLERARAFELGVVLIATAIFNIIFMRRPIFYIIYEQTPEDRYEKDSPLMLKMDTAPIFLNKLRQIHSKITLKPQVELITNKHQIATLKDFRFHIQHQDANSKMLCAMLSISTNVIKRDNKIERYPYAYLVYVFKGEASDIFFKEIQRTFSNIITYYGSIFRLDIQYQDGNVVYVIRKSDKIKRSYVTNVPECQILMDIANVIDDYFSNEKERLESLVNQAINREMFAATR